MYDVVCYTALPFSSQRCTTLHYTTPHGSLIYASSYQIVVCSIALHNALLQCDNQCARHTRERAFNVPTAPQKVSGKQTQTVVACDSLLRDVVQGTQIFQHTSKNPLQFGFPGPLSLRPPLWLIRSALTCAFQFRFGGANTPLRLTSRDMPRKTISLYYRKLRLNKLALL